MSQKYFFLFFIFAIIPHLGNAMIKYKNKENNIIHYKLVRTPQGFKQSIKFGKKGTTIQHKSRINDSQAEIIRNILTSPGHNQETVLKNLLSYNAQRSNEPNFNAHILGPCLLILP